MFTLIRGKYLKCYLIDKDMDLSFHLSFLLKLFYMVILPLTFRKIAMRLQKNESCIE